MSQRPQPTVAGRQAQPIPTQQPPVASADQQYLVPAPQHIESASATTDHAANHTGAGPYVVVGICLVAGALLCALLGGCVGSLVGATAFQAFSDTYDYLDDYGYDDFYGYGWDDYGPGSGLGGLLGDYGADAASSDTSSRTVTRAEAVETLATACSPTLNDEVAATDYAGCPASVRAYVKGLCTVDANASRDVSSSLQAALGALDRDDAALAADELRAASERATEAAAAPDAMELPTDASSEVTASLTNARELVRKRWEAAAEAASALADASDEVSARTARSAEEASDDLLWDGADDLLEALQLSAG